MSTPSKTLPLYLQIAESLQERIDMGEFYSGDRLPSERRLSESFEVNRLTVRRAFSHLENKGIIERKHGGGTFVTHPKLERQAAELFPFTLAMKKQGFVPGDRVIHVERQVPSRSVAQNLNLDADEKVYAIFRVRLINEQPVMLERFFFSASRFPDFEQFNHSERSGYEIMQTEYGVTVKRAEQSLEPVIASPFEAKLLETDAGKPLMLERRLSFDENDQAVEVGKDLYRGDKFRFVTQMAPLLLEASIDAKTK